MNNHNINMGIKKLIETTLNSLKLLRIGELTALALSTLTPVSKEAGFCASRVVFRKSEYFICSF
jgi:hypothetical protein